MRHKRIIGTVEKFVNSTRQDSTSMNLMTEVIMCDAIEQSKFIKLGCKPPLSGEKYISI